MKYRAPVLLAVGMEGFWGLVLCSVALPTLEHIHGADGRPLDSFTTAWAVSVIALKVPCVCWLRASLPAATGCQQSTTRRFHSLCSTHLLLARVQRPCRRSRQILCSSGPLRSQWLPLPSSTSSGSGEGVRGCRASVQHLQLSLLPAPVTV